MIPNKKETSGQQNSALFGAEKKCPLCGKDNGCMVNSGKQCWCEKVSVPEGLLKSVPEAYRGKRCICRNCIDSYKENPIAFKCKIILD